jgi:hypothetical protein
MLRWRSQIFRFSTTVWLDLEVSCYSGGGLVVVFVEGGLDFCFCSFGGGGDVALAVCYGSGGDECDGTEMDLSWIAVAKMALMGVGVVVVVWVVCVVWW